MNKEEIEFNTNEDIVFQIEMMSYNEYNDKIATANDHIGDIYSYRDIEEMEIGQKLYEKKLSYIAIEQLQSQLSQANNKIEKIKEHIKIFIPYNYDHYNNEYIDGTTDILSIIDEENK